MSAHAIVPSVDPDYWTPPPAPGLYPGVPYGEYDRWAAARSSILRKIEQSPLHARYAMLNPGEDSTKAKDFGQALHCAVLEPDLFPTLFCKAPDVDRRTKEGKAAWLAAEAENRGKRLMKMEDYDACIAMRDSVRAHPTAKSLLEAPGKNEVSAVWKDKETGVPCKGRQDRFAKWGGNWPTVADLKSTTDASPRAFSKSIDTYGYTEQAAMYLDGFQALAPFKDGERRYVLIAVEKDPPYAVAVYELDPPAIEVGRKRYRAALIQYAECLDSGVWPGYADGMDLISLPPWSFPKKEE